jgi:hypothetical protein
MSVDHASSPRAGVQEIREERRKREREGGVAILSPFQIE